MISTRQKFIETYKAFATVDTTKRTTISYRIFGRTTKLDEVLSGAKMLTDSFDTGMQYFYENWPEGAEWPEGVERSCYAPLLVSSVSEAAQ